MKTLPTLLFALCCVTLHAQTIAVPPQAAAVGFTNLVFDDEFTTADAPNVNNTMPAPQKWYPNFWAGATAKEVTFSNGVMTITGGGNLASIASAGSSSTPRPNPTGSFRHFYAEARIMVASKPGTNNGSSWPAFWSWDSGQMYNNFLYPKPGESLAEMDCEELYPYTGNKGYYYYGMNTLHDWGAGSVNLSDTGACNYMLDNALPAISDGNWHTWSMLWCPLTAKTGYVQYFFDGVLIPHTNHGAQTNVTTYLTGVGSGTSAGAYSTQKINGQSVVCYTAPKAGLATQESSYMYLLLGAGNNWPMNVDWVHVWQAGSTPPPPPVLTPQTLVVPSLLVMTQSPYPLPAATSAGLAPTYSVASGPAIVSSNILTLSGAGTVVLTVTQAGNATYAPLAETGSITVTQALQSFPKFPRTLTLPTATSQALNVTYTVVSGPGTVSGNVLTITGAGTIVVNVTQAGNATYATYTDTETVIFP